MIQTGVDTPVRLGLAATLAAAAPAPARQSHPPDKSAYTILNPTPRHLMRDMETDRPDTTESPYTVDAGHLQLEMSLADYSTDSQGSDTTRAWSVAPVLLKVGLLNNVDLQLGLSPYERVTTNDAGASTISRGLGDSTLRVKANLWGNDSGDTALAVMPFVTLPTGTGGLGAGHVEAGVIVPLAISLPAEFNLGAMIEFDFVRAAADDRYVVDLVQTITVGRDLFGDLSGYIEYAGFANLAHDQPYRACADGGLTYALTPDLRLDAGVRVGLTSAADNLGLFLGLSARY